MAAITNINTSGGSTGGIYLNERVQQGLDGVGPDDSCNLFSTPIKGEPQIEMGSPVTPHTTPTEEDSSPPSPAGPIDTPDVSPAGPEGPPHYQDQPVAAELGSIWDIPRDQQEAGSTRIPSATPQGDVKFGSDSVVLWDPGPEGSHHQR